MAAPIENNNRDYFKEAQVKYVVTDEVSVDRKVKSETQQAKEAAKAELGEKDLENIGGALWHLITIALALAIEQQTETLRTISERQEQIALAQSAQPKPEMDYGIKKEKDREAKYNADVIEYEAKNKDLQTKMTMAGNASGAAGSTLNVLQGFLTKTVDIFRQMISAAANV